MAGASRSITIDASMDKVFDTLTAYETYPQFLTECKTVRTSGRQGGTVDVHYEVELMKTISYTLRMKEERPQRITWTFVKGDVMKDNQGSWVLQDLGGGKTQATYTIEMQLPLLVPKVVVSKLVEANLPKMLEAFKKRAEST